MISRRNLFHFRFEIRNFSKLNGECTSAEYLLVRDWLVRTFDLNASLTSSYESSTQSFGVVHRPTFKIAVVFFLSLYPVHLPVGETSWLLSDKYEHWRHTYCNWWLLRRQKFNSFRSLMLTDNYSPEKPKNVHELQVYWKVIVNSRAKQITRAMPIKTQRRAFFLLLCARAL